ncbi:hypothetical protein GCM10009416_11750 [Craurococcus roseus]|uniref:Uncharacterized protein n=1 Tax=Craurococcus roseus TaxID=77585 RepID=A0ABN1EVG5_9PROT
MTAIPPKLAALPLVDFEKTVLSGCLRVVEDEDNPVRLNFFAAGVREIFGHVLHRLAPDREVSACSWFKQEPTTKGPTRKQRAKYATQGGLSDGFIEEAGIDVSHLHDEAIHAVDRLSKFTHIRPGVVVTDQAQIEAFVGDALAALEGLFASFEQCRKQVVEAVFDHIDEEVVSALISDTILSLDELASHHSVEEVCAEEMRVTGITHEAVTFAIAGTVGVELQWGSNSDVRRGDGAVMERGFPFSVTMLSPVDDITRFQDVDCSVDTSGWWEGYYDEE